MVKVTPLVSAAALLSLAAIEVVVAKSQKHFRDSSGFLDTCNQIATSISNASVVYYSRESSITTSGSGLTDFTRTAQPRCSITQTMHTGPNRARHNPHAALSQAPLRTSPLLCVSIHIPTPSLRSPPSVSQCTHLIPFHALNVVTHHRCDTHALCRKGRWPHHQPWFLVYDGSADRHDTI